MKILTFTTLYPNRMQPLLGVFIRERIRHMSNLCEVRVVAPVILPPPKEGWIDDTKKCWRNILSIPREEKQSGLVVYHPRIFHFPKIGVYFSGFYYFLYTYFTILRIKKEYAFDIIDAHWAYPDGLAAVIVGKMLGIPVVISCRGSDVNLYLDLPVLKSLVSFALKQCSGIIAVSESLKDKVQSIGINKEKIEVIANGVDVNSFYNMPTEDIRRKLGVSLNNKTILSIGHLIERKGFHHIIDAMDILVNKQGVEDLSLIIVGEGVYRTELEKKIKNYSLSNHVDLVGAKNFNEIPMWHNVADVFCLASSREGWPNVLFESLACGNPVVATDVWGNPEVITSDDYGILVKNQTGAGLAEALDKALKKKWDRKKIISYAQDNTWDKVGLKVFNYFTKIISSKE